MQTPEPKRLPRLFVVGDTWAKDFLEELDLPQAVKTGSSIPEFVAGATAQVPSVPPTILELERTRRRSDEPYRLLVYETEDDFSINPLNALVYLSERGDEGIVYVFIKKTEDGFFEAYKAKWWFNGDRKEGSGWYFERPTSASRRYIAREHHENNNDEDEAGTAELF